MPVLAAGVLFAAAGCGKTPEREPLPPPTPTSSVVSATPTGTSTPAATAPPRSARPAQDALVLAKRPNVAQGRTTGFCIEFVERNSGARGEDCRNVGAEGAATPGPSDIARTDALIACWASVAVGSAVPACWLE